MLQIGVEVTPDESVAQSAKTEQRDRRRHMKSKRDGDRTSDTRDRAHANQRTFLHQNLPITHLPNGAVIIPPYSSREDGQAEADDYSATARSTSSTLVMPRVDL